ncbi:MAG: hypothetical protein E6J41_33605 [Chloroflexi bacterium]|nr:MAG: hypothetical protein E6J41_33605 [Chloroflexota bacterium]
MGYVIVSLTTVWPVETARAAVVALIEMRRDGEQVVVRDDQGRHVPSPHLLAEAIDQAHDTVTRQALSAVLADHVEFLRLRALDWARERWAALLSSDHEVDLLIMEAQGRPAAELRLADARERERLADIIFEDGSWREAGGSWAHSFGEPPELLLNELARRHPAARLEQLQVGAREQIAFRDSVPPVADERTRMTARSRSLPASRRSCLPTTWTRPVRKRRG